MLDMLDGKVKGFFVVGENPAVGSAQRRSCTAWRWPSSTGWSCATSRRSRRRRSGTTRPRSRPASCAPSDIGTEVFLLPAAAHTEKDGTLHQHAAAAAVAPQGGRAAGRLPLGAVVHVPPRAHHPGEAGRRRPTRATGPLLDLTWDYPTRGAHDEPDAEAVLREINGCDADGAAAVGAHRAARPTARPRAAAGSTAACYADGVNQTARRQPGARADLGRARVGLGLAAEPAHALQPGVGRPRGPAVVGAQALRVVGRGGGRVDRRRTCPTSSADMPPDYVPAGGRDAPRMALRGDEPFVMQADGRGLAVRARAASSTARCPTHYEPHESPVAQPALRRSRRNPARQHRSAAREPLQRRRRPTSSRTWSRPTGSPSTTPRAGCRATLPYLAELQPELFCEVSPELAAERGLEHGGWATIVTRRTAIEARVLVTDRIAPLRSQGRHAAPGRAAVPLGPAGHRRRATRPTTCSRSCSTRTCTSRRSKAATCDIRPGRRPHGPALLDLVDVVPRARAGVT